MATTTPEMKVPSTLASSAQSASDPSTTARTPAAHEVSTHVQAARASEGNASDPQLAQSSATPTLPAGQIQHTRLTPSDSVASARASASGLARLLSRIGRRACDASAVLPQTPSLPQEQATPIRNYNSAAPAPPTPETAASPPRPGTPPLARHSAAAARVLQPPSSPSTPQGVFPSNHAPSDTTCEAPPQRAPAPLPFMSPAGRWRHEGGLRESGSASPVGPACMPQTPPHPQRRGAAWMQRATAVSDSFPSGLPWARQALPQPHTQAGEATRWSWDAAAGGSRPPPLLQPAAQRAAQPGGDLTPVMGPVTQPLLFHGAAGLGVTPPGAGSSDASPHALSELAHILQATPGSLVPGMTERTPVDPAGLCAVQSPDPPQATQQAMLEPVGGEESELSGHSTLMPVPLAAQRRASNPHTRELLAALFSPGPRPVQRPTAAAPASRLPRPVRHAAHVSGGGARMSSPGVSPVPCVPSADSSPIAAEPPLSPALAADTPSRLPVARRLFSPAPRERRVRTGVPPRAAAAPPSACAPRGRLVLRQAASPAANGTPPPAPQPASTSRAAQPVRTASYGEQALSIAVNLLRSPPVRGNRVASRSASRSKSARRDAKRGRQAPRAVSSGRAPLTLEEWQATPGGIALGAASRSAPSSARKEGNSQATAAPASAQPVRRERRLPMGSMGSSAILSSLMFR